jgi:hypothetical protein
MTLATGTKLGPYEILSPLGAAGRQNKLRSRQIALYRCESDNVEL